MTKKYLAAALVIVILIGGAVVLFVAHKHANESKIHYGLSTKPCQIFTSSNAFFLMGPTAAKSPTSDKVTTEKHIRTAACSFTQLGAKQGNDKLTGSLVYKTPNSKHGIKQIKEDFNSAKPKNADKVTAYGDDGYWDPSKGVLQVYKHSTWYTITYGQLDPANRNLSKTEELADLVLAKL
jgi:hypothetical protein